MREIFDAFDADREGEPGRSREAGWAGQDRSGDGVGVGVWLTACCTLMPATWLQKDAGFHPSNATHFGSVSGDFLWLVSASYLSTCQLLE